AHTAWLAPLPPRLLEDRTASTVSPGCGSATTSLTRSRLSEPTITSRDGVPSGKGDLLRRRLSTGFAGVELARTSFARCARHAPQLVPALDHARGQPAEQCGPAGRRLTDRRPVDRAEPSLLRAAYRASADAAADRDDALAR